MLKWALILLLCFVIPFIGIPWLGYELWRSSQQKLDEDTLDNVIDAVMPMSQTKFPDKEGYRRELTGSINNFEAKWQKRRLFEGAVTEPGTLNGHLTIARDFTLLLVAGRIWRVDDYTSYCAERDKQPIQELLDEWALKVSSEQSWREVQLVELQQRAKALEIKILKELKSGKDMNEILDSKQNELLDVQVSNGTWIVSYQKQLIFLNGLGFAVKAQPNEISFSYDKYS